MDEMLDLKQEFFSEAFELLSNMEEDVLELEKNPQSSESINSIFRVAHTIKGGAASLEMGRITVFTHNLESLLDLVRDGKILVDEDIIDILLKSLDILRILLESETEQKEAELGIELATLDLIKNRIQGDVVQNTSPLQDKPKAQNRPAPLVKPVVHSDSEELDLDIESENFKDILLDEFSIGKAEDEHIKQELSKGYHLYLVHVRLDDENEMKSVSGIQAVTAVKGLGSLISAAPSVPEIMETEFIEHLQFLLLSREGQDKIFSKIYLSDVTKEVEVSDISSMFGKITAQEQQVSKDFDTEMKNPLDVIPEQDFGTLRATIEEALSTGFFVYNVRALINEDAMMRSVDSLLVITSLEEIGDIIKATPSKTELQGEEYFPIIDVVLKTKEPKEVIKEKAFITGSTLEIRVSEFRLKDVHEVSSLMPDQQSSGVLSERKSMLEDGVLSSQQEIRGSDSSRPVLSGSSAVEQIQGMSTDTISVPASPSIEKAVEQDVSTVSSLDSSPVPSSKDRLTSKEEARIRGIKSASDTVVAQKTFLKVESGRVDRLLNLVSELVISKAALTELSSLYIAEINELRIAMSDSQSIILDIAEKLGGGEQESLKKLNQYLLGTMNTWRGVDVFETTVGQVSRSINELQEGITQIRMVPIGNIFNRFPRMIRDTSRQLGKKIRLIISGEDTELDKSVIEELADPLMHMIRNSVDHGIETPQERIANGKSEEGIIKLMAIHEGTTIRIEIVDDGKGLDASKILKKAVEKGLVSPGQNLSEEEIYQLILLPGFSTADQVTDLSGRGVGMDVVRRNIEELSGKLSIESTKGAGSRFIIKIPLTLSIIQALVFQVKGFSYAVPLAVISETVPLKQEETKLFERSEVISLGGNLISVIDIAKIFNIKETREDKNRQLTSGRQDGNINTDLLDESLKILESIKFRDAIHREEGFLSMDTAQQALEETQEEQINKYLIVVQTGSKKVGLLVDNIISEQDIVIKPLDKRYASTRGLSGATILGDGSISLIIDVVQIVDLYLDKDRAIML